MTRTLALSLTLGIACQATAPYPAPARREADPLHTAAAPRSDDPAAHDRVRELERACRIQLQARTIRAQVEAMDRVRAALGAVCDLETVGDDPLHWVFRCRSDAFFELGRYTFTGESAAACEALPSLRGAPVNRWVCAGALLQSVLATAERAARSNQIELAIVGHVDSVRIGVEQTFDPCPELRASLGYTPPQRWEPVTSSSSEEERTAGNRQLSWCRAANVAKQLRCGMAIAARQYSATPVSVSSAPRATTDPLARRGRLLQTPAPATPQRALTSVDPCGAYTLDLAHVDATAPQTSVVGAGTAWRDAQNADVCAAPPSRLEAFAGYCAEARRVDVFVKLVPAVTEVSSRCAVDSSDAAGALYCLQECLERRAAPTRVTPALDRPLHVPCERGTALMPDGWYRAPEPFSSPTCRDLDFGLVRRALRIGR